MTWQFELYLLILLMTVGLALVVAVVAWRRREMPGAAALALTMLAVAIWAGLNMLEYTAVGFQNKLFFGKLEYLGIASVPPLWLIFALSYCSLNRFLSRRNLVLLWIIPVVTILMAVTNDLHSWMWQVTVNSLNPNGTLDYSQRGWWWYLAFAYSYGLIIAGTIILGITALGYRRDLRRQMWVLLAAVLIPWIANLLHFLHVDPFGIDLTPFAFALTGIILAFGLFRFQLFDLAPVARDLLVERLDDGVIVLDRLNRIVDVNPAGLRYLGTALSPIGRPAEEVFAPWPDLVERYREAEQVRTEIRLEPVTSSAPTYIDLRISPLRNRRDQLIGRLLTLHDVTQHKQTEARLRQLSATVEQSPASVIITDLAGRIVYVNPKFTQLTGYTFEEALGQTPRMLKSGETSPAEYTHLWQTILAGGEWHGEFHNRKKTGELYWESAVISPIADAAGRTTHFLAVKEDITARKRAAAIEQQRILRQQLVSEISLAINLSEDVQAVLQTAVDGLTRVLDIDEAGLALFNETRQCLVVQADHPAPDNQSAVGAELPLAGNLSMQHVLATRQPLMILDAQHDPLMSNVLEFMLRQQIQSILIVPLIVREEVVGTIGLDALHALRAFTPDEIDLASTVANLVAVRLEQARLFEAEREARLLAQRHTLDLSGLYAVTRATSRSLAMDDVLAQALSSALTSWQFEAGLIALAGSDGAGAGLQVAAERGLPPELLKSLIDGASDQSLLTHTYRQREVAVLDLRQDAAPDLLQQVPADFMAAGWQTIVGIPLLHRDQPLGVMCLLAHQPRAASPVDMALFASMGHQVAAAISNAQLFQATLSERSRLKALIEASRDGIILNSVDGMILVMNLPALTMLRLPGTPADWVNRPILEAIQVLRHTAPQAARATIGELRRLRMDAAPTAEGGYEVLARPIRWQSLPVRVGTRPMGRLIVMRDMTEEFALERLREDMTHTMVHDLRNPLTGISAALHMVLDGYLGVLPPEQHRLLSIAQSSTDRMMQLVSAILDVNRLESGRMPVNLSTTTVSDLLRDILPAQMTIAQDRHIRLDCQLPSDLPPVRADMTLIQRVLQNLVGNALKFAPEGGCVEISARTLAEPGVPPVVLMVISDNGPGIPPEIQSQLFQKFVTGGQEEHGSGLGLAFCKLAVEAHEQRIWVESDVEKGSTFTFTLAAVS